ncbi:MAG: RecQ family ATP-dependent DNA helicase [Ignavibacteriaceae bacterium]
MNINYKMTPHQALEKYFGYKKFRFGQEEIIKEILAGNHVLAVLPTGAGKSLCYQIPALISENFSIVVSPLIALMKDQVDGLNKTEMISAFINSSLEYYEIERILKEVSYGKIKLLYVAPERFENLYFAEKIKQLNPNFVFVDEAHCISEWGHNFRPSYRKIKEFLAFSGVKKIAAFTATATPEVREDILVQLGLHQPKVFVKGFERDNLSIQVINTKKKDEKVVELVSLYKTPAIIYTSSRKKAEDVSQVLSMYKIKNSFYHAGLTSAQRKRIQEEFLESKTPVIIATNAFGMGIDKKDIRLVIHYNMPGTIENYYQEIGRAGRDGKPSTAVLLFEPNDSSIHQYFIQSTYPDKELIQKLYEALCTYGKVKIGEIKETEIPINYDYIASFIKKDFSKSSSSGLLNAAIKILEEAGHVKLISDFERQNSLQIIIDLEHLKNYTKHLKSPLKKELIIFLLRKFGSSLFTSKINFSIQDFANELSASTDEIDKALLSLQHSGILEYTKPLGRESLFLKGSRVESSKLNINYMKLNQAYFHAQKKLEQMIDFVYAKECRFKFILKYFGEDVTGYKCNKCDTCVTKDSLPESTIDYLREILLRTAHEMDLGVTETQLVAILSGSSKATNLKTISSFGVCSTFSKQDIITVLRYLIDTEDLQKDTKQFKKIFLTNKGKQFLLQKGIAPQTEKPQDYEKNLELFHLLKEARDKVAAKFAQPKYIVCGDDVLRELAEIKPATHFEMLKIKGFNQRMYTKLGAAFLDIIESFEANDATLFSEIKTGKRALPSSITETYQLIQKGFTLEEIAKTRKLAEPVISMQVETILEYIPETDISALLSEELYQQIAQQAEKGFGNLKELKRRLPEYISYAAIRIVVAKMKTIS